MKATTLFYLLLLGLLLAAFIGCVIWVMSSGMSFLSGSGLTNTAGDTTLPAISFQLSPQNAANGVEIIAPIIIGLFSIIQFLIPLAVIYAIIRAIKNPKGKSILYKLLISGLQQKQATASPEERARLEDIIDKINDKAASDEANS